MTFQTNCLFVIFIYFTVFITFNESSHRFSAFNEHLHKIKHLKFNIKTVSVASFEPIDNACTSYYKDLTKFSSEFFECVVNNSRPFNLCRNCLKYYLNVKEIHNLISEDSEIYATSLYKNGLTCQNIIEATDRVQTTLKVFDTIDDIWSTARCNDCFESYNSTNGSVVYTLKEHILQFYDLQHNLEMCIFNYTSKPPSIDPLFENYTSNCTLCSNCKDYYVNLTKYFMNMGAEYSIDENNMCMDVVDLFNYTRISWSKGYKCNYRKIDEANILIISGIFISATTLFYLALRLLYKKE